jgi:hypothetical protein
MTSEYVIEKFIRSGAFLPYSVIKMIKDHKDGIEIKQNLTSEHAILIVGIANSNDQDDNLWKQYYSCVLAARFKNIFLQSIFSSSYQSIKDIFTNFSNEIQKNRIKHTSVYLCISSELKEKDKDILINIEKQDFCVIKDVRYVYKKDFNLDIQSTIIHHDQTYLIKNYDVAISQDFRTIYSYINSLNNPTNFSYVSNFSFILTIFS